MNTSTTGYSICRVIADAKASNNGRLIGLAMTGAQVRCAEKAVARGLMVKSIVMWPGYGAVASYSIA